jgi:hypothetical protein
VQQFPNGSGKVQVSTAGGAGATWRKDGRELFYLVPNGNEIQVVAVPITFIGSNVTLGAPASLFSIPLGSTADTLDGEKFLINSPIEDASPITVILNWKP